MKTILVPTDFSQPAENAAHYAIYLAKIMKANILLCHAFQVPLETTIAAQVTLPLMDYSDLKEDSNLNLRSLAALLTQDIMGFSNLDFFDLRIDYISEVGRISDVIRNLVKEKEINIVVMGMYGASALNHFSLGSNSYEMMNKANFPLLLIPGKFHFTPLRKIAFATDLEEDHIGVIRSLTSLAKHFSAEILLAHIYDKKINPEKHHHKLIAFLDKVTNRVDYSKIYYRQINRKDIDQGLEWLTEHGLLDMLAIVHHHRNILDQIFNRSHTRKLSKHIEIPLLVFPFENQAIF